MNERFQVSLRITCPACGQEGDVCWEEDDGNAPGLKDPPTLVQVSPGFHAELGRTGSGDPAIVCDDCDELQDDLKEVA